MIVSIAKLDFKAAFGYNHFLFVTGPFILAYLVCSEVKYVTRGERLAKKWDVCMCFELALAILYGILRNIF